MKNSYEIRDGYAVIFIEYKGSKIEPGIYECLVDIEILETIKNLGRSIHLMVSKAGKIYARYKQDGVNKCVHHLVLPIKDGYDVDHINNSNLGSLDNRSSNLRYLPRKLNSRNTDKHRVSKHGYKWVAKNKNKYAANVRYNMKKHYLGNYDTPLEAHRVANRWVYENIGSEFCIRKSIKID